MKTASWVIVERSTGKALAETFSEGIAKSLAANARYEVLPIMEYLQGLNRKV